MKPNKITSPNEFVDFKSIRYTSVIKSKILNPLLGRNKKFNIVNLYGPMYIIDVTMTPSNVILVDYNRLNHRVKLF